MLHLQPQDDDLTALRGHVLSSDSSPGARYRLDKCVGVGGMSVAFFALRRAPEGECPTVVKIMRPWFVRQSGPAADISFRKEAVALGRLNERTPSTPFVVRLIDVGVFAVAHGAVELGLPWLAIEHVHGGAEGTTLVQRVEYAMRATGHAFDPARAARAIECLAEGLEAIHEVQVTHRDLKPENVLCCGFGAEEMFKITDFGIARPAGVAATFGGIMVGTPGYAAPEQAALDETRVGPWTDVFAFAAVVYFLLTGEDYFRVASPADAILISRRPERRRLAECPGLCAELRDREAACRSIDGVLASATSVRGAERPQSAKALASLLLPWLRSDARRPRTDVSRLRSVVGDSEVSKWATGEWTVRHRPGGSRVIRSVAWNSDGRCLAVTDQGLAFWNGTTWRDAPSEGLPNARGLHVVQQISPGQWLLAGDESVMATYSTAGVQDVVRGDDPSMRIRHADGDFNDLAVVVASTSSHPVVLHAVSSRRWIKPLPLEDVSHVSCLARFDDARWLLAGRSRDGSAFAGVYEPLQWAVTRLSHPPTGAYLAGSTQPERGAGLVVGTAGSALVIDSESVRAETIDARFPASAAAMDIGGRAWAAAAGRIWVRAGRDGQWLCVWEEASWTAPMVSIYADVGIVLAMTADGGIIEGRG